MVFPYTSYLVYLILLLITSCTDAVNMDTVNITAVRGGSICLPCTSELYSAVRVSVTWRKIGSHGKMCQYYVENGTKTNVIRTCKHHINVTDRQPMLCLTGVKTRDAGYYNCSVSKLIPPPEIERFNVVNLHIEGPPRAFIEQQTSNKSGCLWLLCELDGLEPEQVNLTWSRNGEIMSETNSSLYLCKPKWSKGDIFTCSSQSSKYTDLTANFTIKQTDSTVVDHSEKNFLIIICVGALAGTLVLICLAVCIYKCKTAYSSSGSIIYTNKVYENFSFGNPPQRTQGNDTTNKEQCIYEN